MKERMSRGFLIAWVVVMIAGTVLMFAGITHESIWYDESYTASLVKHSFFDIVSVTGSDSHPPLYYLMLRVFTLVFGGSLLSLRAFSVVGTVCLAVLGIGPVRRALGNRFGLIFSFLVFMLPIVQAMSQEARMYTWAAFFVTGGALYGYLACRDGTRKNWILFGALTLCAAYTHYYALLAAVMIVLVLFVMMLAGRKKLKPLLITAGAAAAGYLPWLFSLAAQMKRVSGDFWIPRVTGNVVTETLIYPFGSKFCYLASPLLPRILFGAAAALIVLGFLYRIVSKDEKGNLALLAVGGYALTILAGVVASHVIRPVLVARYMVPVLGLFVLGLCYGIGTLGKKWIPIAVCAALLAACIPQIHYNMSHRFNGPMREATDYVETEIRPGDVFLHVDEHTLGTFIYHFPEYTHYYYQKPGTGGYSNYDAFLPAVVMPGSIDEVQCGGTVWMIQRQGGTDTTSFSKWLLAGKVTILKMAKTFWIDTSWYCFDVYEVSMGAAE
ncbi:MAG: glycosyltransferase family 39 protein [Clostridiales bacterium]|nr:glycosyltransferase family 39 protein [Clostridiales bacterium]